MPTFVRKGQSKATPTWNGYLMTTVTFDNIIAYHGVEIKKQTHCGKSVDGAWCKPTGMLTDEEHDFDFMCGECGEEDLQSVSQELEAEQVEQQAHA